MNTDELIAALEAAEGPSRELDNAIHDVIQSDRSLAAMFERAARKPVPDPGFRAPVPADVPPYTASIDDALMLVPEGWKLGDLYEVGDGLFHSAVIPRDEGAFVGTEKPAASLALALCIAALRARKEQP